mgnify:CR=1 FL=1
MGSSGQSSSSAWDFRTVWGRWRLGAPRPLSPHRFHIVGPVSQTLRPNNPLLLVVSEYTWLIVVHAIVAWLDAYGIGANDVAK